MKTTGFMRPSGFTLMEMVIAILLLAIASATVIVLYGNLYSRNTNTENAQEGALLVQSCVETITGLRKQSSGFFSTSTATLSTSCNYLPTLHNSGTGISLSVTASTPTSTTPPCPASPVSCIKFVIRARDSSNVQVSPDTTLFFINR